MWWILLYLTVIRWFLTTLWAVQVIKNDHVTRAWPHIVSRDIVMWWSRDAIGSFNCILEILKVQIAKTIMVCQKYHSRVRYWYMYALNKWSNDDVILPIGIFITSFRSSAAKFSEIQNSYRDKDKDFGRIKAQSFVDNEIKFLFRIDFLLLNQRCFWLGYGFGFVEGFGLVDKSERKWTFRNLEKFRVHSKICPISWTNKKPVNTPSWSIFRKARLFRFQSFWGFLEGFKMFKLGFFEKMLCQCHKWTFRQSN